MIARCTCLPLPPASGEPSGGALAVAAMPTAFARFSFIPLKDTIRPGTALPGSELAGFSGAVSPAGRKAPA